MPERPPVIPEASYPPSTQPLETSWERARVQPASAVYVGRDDRLLVRSWCSIGAAELQVRGRLQLVNGQVVPFAFRHAPSSDRSLVSTRHDLAEGFLLSLTVEEVGTVVRRGRLFVQVAIDRGGAVGGIPTELLVSDYATDNQVLGWPGGLLRSSLDGPGLLGIATGSDPAAGAEISLTVPTNVRYRLIFARFSLVTDATVADRRVHVQVDDGNTLLLELAAADVQAAGLTRNYNCAIDGFARAAQGSEIFLPLPADLLLFQAWRFRTLTTNLQAGDNFSVVRLITEEWIEE
jgi:hypothetical protein